MEHSTIQTNNQNNDLQNSPIHSILDMETALDFLFQNEKQRFNQQQNKKQKQNESESVENDISSIHSTGTDSGELVYKSESVQTSAHETIVNNAAINVNTTTITKTFIDFRKGQAGDSSILASMYRKQQRQQQKEQKKQQKDQNKHPYDQNEKQQEKQEKLPEQRKQTYEDQEHSNSIPINASDDSSSLECMLATGFGDEHTPPSFHAIIVDIYSVVETSVVKESVASISMTPPSQNKEDISQGQTQSNPNAKNNLQKDENYQNKSNVQSSPQKNQSHTIDDDNHPPITKAKTLTSSTTSSSTCSSTVITTKTTTKHPSQTIAACILCLDWDVSQLSRILKCEFFYVDESIPILSFDNNDNNIHSISNDIHLTNKDKKIRNLIARRLLLRIATLGLVTGCQGLNFEDASTTSSNGSNGDMSDMIHNGLPRILLWNDHETIASKKETKANESVSSNSNATCVSHTSITSKSSKTEVDTQIPEQKD